MELAAAEKLSKKEASSSVEISPRRNVRNRNRCPAIKSRTPGKIECRETVECRVKDVSKRRSPAAKTILVQGCQPSAVRMLRNDVRRSSDPPIAGPQCISKDVSISRDTSDSEELAKIGRQHQE